MSANQQRQPTDPPLRERLKRDLLEATKARQTADVATLRSLLAAIDNAESVDPASVVIPQGWPAEVPRKLLSEADIAAVVAGEAGEAREALRACAGRGRPDEERRLRATLELISGYLGEPAA